MYGWYTLYTRFNCERQVARLLEAQSIETFLPMVRKKNKTYREPFFPCYIFVRLDAEAGMLDQARYIPNVRFIVAFGETPAMLTDEVIAALQQRIAQIDLTGGLPKHILVAGDAVRVISGPLAGMEAVFQEDLTPKQRVLILLDFLGAHHKVDIPSANVEKVKESGPWRPRKGGGAGARLRQNM